MTIKIPNAIDKHVGSRLRMRRMMSAMVGKGFVLTASWPGRNFASGLRRHGHIAGIEARSEAKLEEVPGAFGSGPTTASKDDTKGR
jgi:hypothetical protein